MQQMLFKQLSVKTPLSYFGSKRHAVPVLSKFIPMDVEELVSPFFGSGAFELALTGRGIRIWGYDKYEAVANFWQIQLSQPIALCNAIQHIVDTTPHEAVANAVAVGYQESECRIERAAYYCLILTCSFNGMGRGAGHRSSLCYEENGIYCRPTNSRHWIVVNYEQIERFHNPLVQMQRADFRDSLAEHPKTFAYLDPPYPVSSNCYGDSDEYHKDFPHQDLADILHNRSDWVLSYNDVQQIQELYPEDQFDWYRVQWQQGSRRNHDQKSNDVVITPRGQHHAKSQRNSTQVPQRDSSRYAGGV